MKTQQLLSQFKGVSAVLYSALNVSLRLSRVRDSYEVQNGGSPGVFAQFILVNGQRFFFPDIDGFLMLAQYTISI